MSNTIETLREHLFGTLSALRDKEAPMPIDRAKAVADVAQAIINSARVEVDMINAVGAKNMSPTSFIPQAPKPNALEHAPRATPGAGLPPQGPKGSL
jgi:hypothetical protein